MQLTQRLRNRIVGDGIHHSDFERLCGGDFFRGDEKLERSALADQTRQALRTSPSGHEAESGAAMSKDGVGRGDPAVTGEREIETSAHAVAINGGDDGDGVAGDCVHECLSHGGELAGFGAGQCGDFVQVGADREKMAIARDDQRAELLLQFVFEFSEGRGQCEHAGAGKAVGAVGRSEAQDARRAVGPYSEEERRHRNMMHY